MNARLRKLRLVNSKKFKRGWQEIENATSRHAHRFITSRWRNLQEVRRHAVGWALLVLALSMATFWQSAQLAKLYTVEAPSKNTTYTEGVFGAVENLNPIFASTPAERSASRLLFANLLDYDEHSQLVGELAKSWSVDETGKIYTLTLRSDARWHDGVPVTSQDVLFTMSAIKNVDTKSPLYSSWRSIAVEKIDNLRVRFILPAAYAPFLNSLVLGIIPEHVLGRLQPSELRNNGYNHDPMVADGPFMLQDVHAVDVTRGHYVIRMSSNKDYFKGASQLSTFNLHSYADREQLLSAFRTQEVGAVSDLTTRQLNSLGPMDNIQHTESPLYNAVYAFLKTSSPMLQDVRVRKALELATDQAQLIKKLDGRVSPVTGPLLPGQLGYKAETQQAGTDLTRAKQLLDEAGWKVGQDGKRSRDGQPLQLQLMTVSAGDYPLIAEELMNQWIKLGISFNAQQVRADDIQQNVIAPRAYDVLIYEIAIGRDPDVFAYWHSSQATDHGFNLSDYKSAKIDELLDGARGHIDVALREAKYHSFIQQWLADVPAIGLYRPSLSYVQTRHVTSFSPHPLVDQTSRYYNVLDWSAGKELLHPTL
ncbi:MAG TPA: peptide ABC transporter substrate-binding protein [Patescibacteria group bacterium]|jgi:peptide/nickel transport system substrate-binding protein|nr:peptide ABC transporter substrate-binding protein [Patescibacteria group bacterium]